MKSSTALRHPCGRREGWRATSQWMVLVFALTLVVVFAATGTAHAGTVTVNLKSNNWQGYVWHPVIQPAAVYVYGPQGYYRSAWCPGSDWTAGSRTMTYQFAGAPSGAYPSLASWYPWLTVNFTSPR
jgi:hypothetical protein